MANEKSIAHELLAQEILKNFKGKITGDNADYIVGENPENRYFVGKLFSYWLVKLGPIKVVISLFV